MTRQTSTISPTRTEEAAAVVAALEFIVARYRAHTAIVALAAAQAALEFARDGHDRDLVVGYVHELQRVEGEALTLGSAKSSLSMRGVQLARTMLYLALETTVDGAPMTCPIIGEAARLAEQACLVAA